MFEITFKCNGKKMYYEIYSVIIQINTYFSRTVKDVQVFFRGVVAKILEYTSLLLESKRFQYQLNHNSYGIMDINLLVLNCTQLRSVSDSIVKLSHILSDQRK